MHNPTKCQCRLRHKLDLILMNYVNLDNPGSTDPVSHGDKMKLPEGSSIFLSDCDTFLCNPINAGRFFVSLPG